MEAFLATYSTVLVLSNVIVVNYLHDFVTPINWKTSIYRPTTNLVMFPMYYVASIKSCKDRNLNQVNYIMYKDTWPRSKGQSYFSLSLKSTRNIILKTSFYPHQNMSHLCKTRDLIFVVFFLKKWQFVVKLLVIALINASFVLYLPHRCYLRVIHEFIHMNF